MTQVFLAVSWLAFAQASNPPALSPEVKEQAKRAFGQAAEAYAAGRFQDALDEFTKSYQLSGRGELLFSIAQCHERLEQWELAIQFFNRYLTEMPDGKSREQAKQKLADAEQQQAVFSRRLADGEFKRGSYQSALDDYQKAYRVSRNGELLFDIAQCQEQLAHLVDAGASYQEYLDQVPDGKFRPTAAKQLAEIKQRLILRPVETTVVTPDASQKRDLAPTAQSHPSGAAVGVGAAGIALGAVAIVGLVEALSFTRYTSQPPGTQLTPSSVQSRVNTANTWATVSLICGIGAGVGIGTGVILW